MKNRNINFVLIIKDMWREKIMCIIILGASLGYFNHKKEVSRQKEMEAQISGEQTEGESEYVTQLRNYEDALNSTKDALAIAEEQRDNLQSYIENSILMKIDPSDVKVAYCSYAVQDATNPGNVLNAFVSYINDGGLKEDIASKRDDLETEGFREIITTTVSGNNLSITVNHYDETKAKVILDEVKRCVDIQKGKISSAQGDFTLTLVSESFYTKIDNSIANTQNTNNNNLKNYKINISDYLTKLNTIQTNIDNYKEKNELTLKPDVKRGLKKNVALYALAGFIGGIILSFAVLAIKATVSDKVACTEHLRYAGLPVINVFYIRKKCFLKKLDNTIDTIERVLDDAKEDNICLYLLSEGGYNKKIQGLLEKELSEEINVSDRLSDSKKTVAILTSKKDRYSDIDDLLEECERLKIKLLGFIVVE